MSTRAPQPAATAFGLSRRALLPVALMALALVTLAVIAGLNATGRRDASFPPGSPQAAFQGYLHAWDTGDPDSAYAVLSDAARSRVPEREFRQAHRWSGDETVRIWIDNVSGTDDRRTLTIAIESVDTGILGSEGYSEEMRIRMVRQDGAWKIDTPLVGYYPW